LEYIIGVQTVAVALGVGFCGGICCVLIDIDHPISYWIKGKTSRPFHIPLAIIACVVIIYIIAYN
jgi:hypothetical protein